MQMENMYFLAVSQLLNLSQFYCFAQAPRSSVPKMNKERSSSTGAALDVCDPLSFLGTQTHKGKIVVDLFYSDPKARHNIQKGGVSQYYHRPGMCDRASQSLLYK